MSRRLAESVLRGAALAIAVALGCARTAVADAPPRVGVAAPDFTLPVIANGHGTISLHALKGHAVYLNFFASWCGPCKTESPWIAKYARAYASDGLVVVGINLEESLLQAQRFAQRYHLPYPIALDAKGEIGGEYGLIGMPLHVFIDAAGRTVAWRTGELRDSEIAALIQQALKK